MNHDPEFEDLFRRYYRRVFVYFLQRGFSSEDSRDLAQNVFLRVHRGRSDYRGESEWTYIETIAKRVLLNELRYRKTLSRGAPTVSLEDLQPSESNLRPFERKSPDSPEDELLAKEKQRISDDRRERLRRAVQRLPGRQRNAMLLRIYGGLKYREIAVVLGVSLDTVKQLLYEAKKKLSRELGE